MRLTFPPITIHPSVLPAELSALHPKPPQLRDFMTRGHYLASYAYPPNLQATLRPNTLTSHAPIPTPKRPTTAF